MAYEGKWLGDYVGEWLGAQENNPGAMSANIGGSGTITATITGFVAAVFVGGVGQKKKKKAAERKVRKDIEAAYALLIEHPEPSIVREVREIVGTAQLDTLAQPKITQLLTLAREVEEEEELLLLLL